MIIDLSNEVGNVRKLDQENFILKSSSRAVKIQLHTVSVDRGLSFERADNLRKQALDEENYFKDEIGYYVSNSVSSILLFEFFSNLIVFQTDISDS